MLTGVSEAVFSSYNIDTKKLEGINQQFNQWSANQAKEHLKIAGLAPSSEDEWDYQKKLERYKGYPVKEIHTKLFPEEYDYMLMDDSSDAKLKIRGSIQ